MTKPSRIRLLLFRLLPFPIYLRVLSSLFFISYRLGGLRNKPEYAYFYYLRHYIAPGWTVIDIGANLGYFSKLFSAWVGSTGHVHAVEPVKEMRDQLIRNTRKSNNVTIYPYALGAEEKEIILGNTSRSKLGYIASGQHFVLESNQEASDTFPAQMKRGSSLFASLPQIHFIKCDVEGYETVILRDLRPLLEKHHPSILLESGGEKRQEMFAYLSSLGYQCYELQQQVLAERIHAGNSDTDLLYIYPAKL
jgi:FkbM family methyltransferase